MLQRDSELQVERNKGMARCRTHLATRRCGVKGMQVFREVSQSLGGGQVWRTSRCIQGAGRKRKCNRGREREYSVGKADCA
jgi:hypothetical protein